MSARPIATTRSVTGIPTGRLAIWWVVASEIVIFGGILASYIMYRLAHDAFAVQAAHTSTPIGAFNTFVLLTSSLFAVLGHKAATDGDGPKAARMLVLEAPTVLGWKAWCDLEQKHEVAAFARCLRDAGALTEPPETLAQVILGALTTGARVIATAQHPEAARADVQKTIERLISGLRSTAR